MMRTASFPACCIRPFAAARHGGRILLALAAVAAAANGAHAAVLVDNLSVGSSLARNVGNVGGFQTERAVKFHTGDNAAGYDLDDVQLIISTPSLSTLSESQPVVTIHEAVGNSPAQAVLYPMTISGNLNNGTKAFNAPAGAMLARDTDYFVVVANASTGSTQLFGIETTDGDGEDLNGLPDWEIANVGRQRSDGGNWIDMSAGRVPQIRVRGSAVVPPPPEILVDNTTESNDIEFNSLVRYAQRFRTGPGSVYTLTSVEISVGAVTATSTYEVSIHRDSSDTPGGSLGMLMATATSTAAGALNEYTTDGIDLDADTRYFVVVAPTSVDASRINATSSTQEESNYGWILANFGWGVHPASPHRWDGLSGILQLRINGAAMSTDAALSGLALENAADDSEVVFSPTFATATTDYTARVLLGVEEITLLPETGDDGATVEYLDASDAPLADADTNKDGHQVALDEGVNTVKVKVTAEDGATTSIYTVTVTRALAQVMNVQVTAGGGSLTLGWDAVDFADGYKVQWRSGTDDYGAGAQAVVNANASSTVSHTITGLTNDTEYTLRVIATKTGANDGPPSTEIAATPSVLPAATIGDATAREGRSLEFPVTLNRAVSGGMATVDYATSDGTATSVADYTAATTTTLVFASGEREKTITVATVNDSAAESFQETMTVTLSNPSSNAQLGAKSTATGTIEDNDSAKPFLFRISHINAVLIDHNTVGGSFWVRIHFTPGEERFMETDLSAVGGTIRLDGKDLVVVTGGTVADFRVSIDGTTSVLRMGIDITPGVESVTVRVPPDALVDGNQPVERSFTVVTPPVGRFSTDAVEPVQSRFVVTLTWDEPVTDDDLGAENDEVWKWTPADDVVIRGGRRVSHRVVSSRVTRFTVDPQKKAGKLVVTLLSGTVATGATTEVWNAEAKLVLRTGMDDGRPVDEIELVANTVEAIDGGEATAISAQSFDTGDVVGGYLITGIGVYLGSATSSDMRVRLAESAGDNPGAYVATLTAVAATSTANAVNLFNPPGDSPTILEPGERYFVVVDNNDGSAGGYKLQRTNSTEQDGVDANWEIADDRRLKNNPGDAWTTNSNNILMIEVRGIANSPSSGRPTILPAGTPAVGDTLTAATSTAMMDENGMCFSCIDYQWVRVDGGTDTPIPNADDRTYTVVAADEGKRLKVRLLMVDGLGFTEVFESLATDAVPSSEVTVRFANPTLSVDEGDSVQITVVLSGTTTPATVFLSTSNRGGATGADWNLAGTGIAFQAGQTENSTTFSVVDDNIDDDGESVVISFRTPLPDGVVLAGAATTTTVTLVDNDDALPPPPIDLGQVLNLNLTPEAEALSASWLAVSQATGYEVQWRGPGESFVSSRQRTTASTATRIAGLDGGTTYRVRVRATAGSVQGDWSSERSATTQPAADKPVVSLRAVRTSVGAGDQALFEVRRAAQSGKGIDLGGETRFTIGTDTRVSGEPELIGAIYGGIRSGQTTVRISSVMADRGRSYTEVLTLKPQNHYVVGSPSSLTVRVRSTSRLRPPAAVAGLVATPAYRQLDLTWNSASGANVYRVDWGGNSRYADGRSFRVKTANSNSTTVRVRGVRTTSNPEDEKEGEAAAVTATPLSQPLQVGAVQVGNADGNVRASWSPTADARAYEVAWKSGTQAYSASRTERVRRTSYLIAGLPAGATYAVRVRGATATDPRSVDYGNLNYDFQQFGDWSPETTGTAPNAMSMSASVDGARLTVRFDAALDAASTPSGRDFVVLGGTAADVPVAVSSVALRGRDAVLTLSRAVSADETVRLSYLAAAMHPLRSAAGVPGAAVTGMAVRNATGVGIGSGGDIAPVVDIAAPHGPVPFGIVRYGFDPSAPRPVDLGSLAARAERADLRELDLRGSMIADLTPLATLTGLRVLDLADNRIEELWPLAGLDGLERLNLSDNRIVDLAPLAELPGLEVLLLDRNRIVDILPLSQLAGLLNLGLSGNRIADPELLAELAGLQRLDLSDNALADVSALGDVVGLVWLHLAGNPVTDVSSLGRLTRLQWLWLDARSGGLPRRDDASAPVVVRRGGNAN